MNPRNSRGTRRSTTLHSSALALGLSLLLGSTNARADGKTESLSLAEFAALLAKGLPEDALVRAGVLDAEAEVERAKTLPELGISLERQEVFAEGEGVVLQSSIALGWSLDLSGRRGLRLDAANASLQATRLRGERAHGLVAVDATAIYLQAARARNRLASLERSRQPLVKLTDAVGQRAKEGDVSGADVARFALALSEHDDRIAEARAALEIAETRLGALLGRPGRIVATEDLALPQTPLREPAATRPDIRAADEEIGSGHALINAASRWWVPTLDLSAGYLSTDFGPGSGPGADVARGYLATLSLSLPIFSRGQAERKTGEAQVARARAKRAVLERRVSAETAAARMLLASSVERVKAHEETRLPLAAELVQKTESAYAGGEATALDLRDAYEKSAEAQLRALELRYEARLAELELWRAAGLAPNGAQR